MLFLFENLDLLAFMMIFQLFPPLLFSISDLKTMFETLLLSVFLSMLCEISLSIKLIFFDEIDNNDWKLYNLLLITHIISFYWLLLVSDNYNQSIVISFYRILSVFDFIDCPCTKNTKFYVNEVWHQQYRQVIGNTCTYKWYCISYSGCIRAFQISPLKINKQQISRVSSYMYLVWTSFNEMKKAYFQDQYRCLF